MMTTIGAVAALAIAAPAVAQPYGSATYGSPPAYAQPRNPSPVPAPGYGPPTGGDYAYPYSPPAQGAGAPSVGEYGADTAYAAPMVTCGGTQKCDQAGAYWSFGDTLPYESGAAARADPNAANYVSRGCRLAPAQASGSDQRYVRVCPDGSGKYRAG